ncbi:MAG TPA: family 20 glycosylhydrolase [Woeseiaceae bacterium]|nr:family 20 glycosylhydrolase [Woeseiaceae bacterium]
MSIGRLAVAVAACSVMAACERTPEAQPEVAVIPAPASVEPSAGPFLLAASTTIVVDGSDGGRRTAEWLAGLLAQTTGLQLAIEDARADAGNAIVLAIAPLEATEHPEAYRLEVTPERVTVRANAAAGLFYGAVSTWQLATAAPRLGDALRLPAVVVHDEPRFAWRGLMLDPARHWIPPGTVKRMLDWMALHKLNVLHWHLTDDQGWRIAIDAYPKLTEVGAWRVPAGPAAAEDIDPETGEPRRYGGFYTKKDVRDIVAHAAARHVTVVPEIDMPGHAQAALAAYPELGTGDVPAGVSADWGVHTWLFGVDEITFEALETILDEVLELFPGEYVHVGGDEAVKKRWIESAAVQARMRELGIEDATALQGWFMGRLEAFLAARGRKLIGWDEILEGGIAPQATVMSWRGIAGAVEAASLGHDTVLSPSPTLYFDHRQGRLASEPPGRDAVITLEDVYRFEPMPAALAPDERRHVLGIQANLWSEHIRTEERLAWMAFPRAAALAEVAWSPPERLDWHSFVRRLPAQFERYRALGLPFATSAFDVHAAARRIARDRVAIELTHQAGIGEIRYTTDGSPVTASAPVYSGILELAPETELAARTWLDGRPMSGELRASVARLSDRRASQELELCTESVVLALEDDAPRDGERAVFLVDILNPCWIWRDVDLAGVTHVTAAVGQVPFNFQFGDQPPAITLPPPATPHGELELRTGGCDGTVAAVLALEAAAASHAVTRLSAGLAGHAGPTDLCVRFRVGGVDPLWVLDWIELGRAADTGPAR